jgi:transposase
VAAGLATGRAGGAEVEGPVSAERLSPAQWARLEAELRRGPLAHGFADDQRWTLARVKTLIGRLFHVGYTVQGTWKLLRRHGWSCQVPVRQAMERDEAAIAVWKAEVWPEIKHRARPRRLRLLRGRGRPGAEAAEGAHLGAAGRPPGGDGARPRWRGRVSIAGVVCYRPGERPRLFYQLRAYRRRKGEPKGFTWQDYRDLIIVTHRQLAAPLVWC